MVPMINLCPNLASGEAVSVSSDCLELPLVLYIISLWWFVGVVPMTNLSDNLAIYCYMGGLWACLKLWGCHLVTFDVHHLFVVVCGCGPHD